MRVTTRDGSARHRGLIPLGWLWLRADNSRQSTVNKPFQVTSLNFEDKVLRSTEPVIVEFYADWSAPSKMLSAVVKQITSEHQEVKVARVNVDHDALLAQTYGVSIVPKVVRFERGNLAGQVVGYQPKTALEAKLGLAGM